MCPAQQTNFSDIALNCDTWFLLDCCLVVTESTFIIFTPPETTKTAEIYTDIGYMQVLVFDRGQNLSCATFPSFICCRCDP
jgi:hypothetical protein